MYESFLRTYRGRVVHVDVVVGKEEGDGMDVDFLRRNMESWKSTLSTGVAFQEECDN